MAKRVFIGFSFREIGLRNDLLRFFQPHGPVQATPAYIDEKIPGDGVGSIEARIRSQMTDCVGLIVLAGEKAHNSPWFRYESGLANELHIPKAAVRHPALSGGLPNAHVGMSEVSWDGDELARLVHGW